MESRCPLCFKNFPTGILESHVNICLDQLELKDPSLLNNQLPTRLKRKNEDAVSTNKGSKDVFSALGLRIDSSEKIRKTDQKKVQKERPTLTSILIAERKLRAKTKRGAQDLITTKQEKDSDEPIIEIKKEKEKDETFSVQSQETKKVDSPRILNLRQMANEGNEVDEQSIQYLRKDSTIPLAQRIRPKKLEDFIGQEHLLGEQGILKNITQSDIIPSFLLWGLPGVGKTSLARIVAKSANYKFVEVSGSEGNAKKLREVFTTADNEKKLTGRKTILFLDEIHRFNKAVQDLLLPVIEKGTLTVIGATTENPSFSLNNALLSRMHTFVMHPLSTDAIVRIIYKGLFQINRTRKYIHGLHHIALKKDAANYLAELSSGDSRTALNLLETLHAYLSNSNFSSSNDIKIDKGLKKHKNHGIVVTAELLKPLLSSQNFVLMYDRQGDMHYDTISAFHKSVRGSDADAAIFYLTKMLAGGEDPLFIARRMIVIASEDIGLRDSSCLPFAIAAKEAVEFIGMPEGEIVLAHCAVKLARSPKSTKSYRALRSAQSLLNEKPEISAIPIPLHLRNAPTKLMKELGYGKSYKYNPIFISGKVEQSYMPEELSKVKFVEKEHLGKVEDPEVDPAELEKAKRADELYLSFKEFKRRELEMEYLKKAEIEKRSNNEKSKDSNERERLSRLRLRLKIQSLLKNDPIFLKDILSKSSNDLKNEDAKQVISSSLNDTSRSKTQEDRINDSSNPGYSYDEFLSKDDQPEYFDGEEKDQYSDDPDCTNNFERSYDEFHDVAEQSSTYRMDDDDTNYMPEYPIS
ncbi:uncharacterized protein PRCAT00000625001 [Priceomyces carsonii]|uniref:uncharacterized protein n=1 Tax=Priceomyces carsonii TaxID=28549 RepID=UPI002ED8FE08|nr:unnamed protein product [Priceomyces carsonii]